MSCAFHNDRDAVAACSECGALICEGCAVNVSSRTVCKHCVEKLLRSGREHTGTGRSARGREEEYYYRKPMFSPGLASLLSFILPGAGHMYLGLMRRGLLFMCSFFLCCYLASGFFGGSIFGFMIPILWILSIFDTNNIKRMILRGETVKDDLQGVWNGIGRHPVVFAIVVFLFFGNFIGNMLYSIFPFTRFNSFVGPLFMGIGIYFVWKYAFSGRTGRRRGDRATEDEDFIDKRNDGENQNK